MGGWFPVHSNAITTITCPEHEQLTEQIVKKDIRSVFFFLPDCTTAQQGPCLFQRAQASKTFWKLISGNCADCLNN